MPPDEARRIIQSLADGCDPISGEEFPADSGLQHPDVVRALCTAALALQRSVKQCRMDIAHGTGPTNRGKPWTALEDQQLCDSFDRRTPIREIAKEHQRTRGAIEARLERLGKDLSPPQPITST